MGKRNKEKVTLINKTKACFFELKISKYFAILTKNIWENTNIKQKEWGKGFNNGCRRDLKTYVRKCHICQWRGNTN